MLTFDFLILTSIGSEKADEESDNTVEHEGCRESVSILIEQVLQKDDNNVHGRDDIDDE
jgi:hypothetical protein